jgi:hypothetical protein
VYPGSGGDFEMIPGGRARTVGRPERGPKDEFGSAVDAVKCAVEAQTLWLKRTPVSPSPLTNLAHCGIAFACLQASRHEEGFELAKKLVQMAPRVHSSAHSS